MQPKGGGATRVRCRTQRLLNYGRRVHGYFPTSSGRVRTALYQRVPQPKNTPAAALLSRQRYVGIGCTQSVRRRCARLLPCRSTTGQAAIKHEAPSKLHSYECFLLARLNLGLFDFILVCLAFSSLLLILKRHLRRLKYYWKKKQHIQVTSYLI